MMFGAHCLHAGPLLQGLTLEFIRCARKEELLTSSNEEELLVAHSIAGKISSVCSHVFLALGSIHRKLFPPQASKLIASYFTLQELSEFFKMSEALKAINKGSGSRPHGYLIPSLQQLPQTPSTWSY